MKTLIRKNAKRALSLVLAFIMLVGALFVANVGVDITADAATTGISEFTDEEKALSLLDSTKANSESNPYIIESANQMYNFMVGNSTIDGVAMDSTGKYFKVADGIKAFYMNGGATVAAMTTPEQVRVYFEETNTNYKKVWSAEQRAFKGHFDGNGVTIYGIGGDGSNAGLFPYVSGDATIKNVTVKNSYFKATNAGGLVGNANTTNNVSVAANSITAENCAVINNYISGSNSGGLFGALYNSLSTDCYPELHINNCIVYGNAESVGYALAGTGGGKREHKISNSILLGGSNGLFNTANWWIKQPQFYEHVYTDAALPTDTTYAAGVIETINPEAIKGKAGKSVMSMLPWATNEVNGYGYWHVIDNDYPTPIKPDGWQDIETAPVWSGEVADSFAGGSGTEKDPYIIETAEQLYKMVRDGGKTSGQNSYYKVSGAITDIYLNSVEDATVDTLKSLASAGVAKNWSKDFDNTTYRTEDTNADGILPAQAFTGYFDGNGVTIHGLYSAINNNYSWGAYPLGFVPAMLDNAVIKNVTFDCSYIYNANSYYAAVITTNVYTEEPDCNVNIALYNVAVRNAHIETTFSYTDSYFGSVAGLVASHGNPDRMAIINCLFDGETSNLAANNFANDMRAGIVSGSTDLAHYYILNCVSLGYPLVPQPTGITMNNYANNMSNCFDDCYQTVSDTHSTGVNVVTATDTYTKDMLPLLNWSIWGLKTVENGRVIPLPGLTGSDIVGYSSIKDMVLEQVGNAGLYSYSGVQPKGTYGQYYKLTGSGTEADPYLITNALQLANAIASGGVNVNQKLYYKLTNDINLGSLAWIDTQTVTRESEGFDEYKYVPFQGTLDGDGYTIYELKAYDTASAGLIPVLDGGTVKNLHVRNSSAISTEGYAGIIAGEMWGASSIIGCSVEDSVVSAAEPFFDGHDIVGYHDDPSDPEGCGYIENSYFVSENSMVYITEHIQEEWFTIYDENNISEMPLDQDIWYISGKEGSTPKLLNRAKAMPCADIDGDGQGYEYGAADLAALRNRLLNKEGYDYVYGDVSGNGKINISDLVILTRATTDDYEEIQDGFWRNLELGKFNIYYGENDNYDAARKLELYLEAAVPGVDIIKAVSGTKVVSGETADKTAIYRHANDIEKLPGEQLAIVVGNVGNYTTEVTDNNYAITYDKQNGVLWLQGANFTAVEQAVLDFINKSDAKSSTVYTVASATLCAEKIPVTVNGTTYYYTWGDEFNGVKDFDTNGYGTGVDEDAWDYSKMGTETDIESSAIPKYYDMEFPLNKDLPQLYDVKDGKLTIGRGTYDTQLDSSWGYAQLETPTFDADGNAYNQAKDVIDSSDIYVSAGKIDTQKSLLVKQGYFEFKASLPSDGHAFMSWWMLGKPDGGNNNSFTNSLYGKVYKYNQYYNGLNPNYTGDLNAMKSNDPSTYKYQLPNSYFEIDIIELMQDITNLPDKNVYGSQYASTSNRILNRSSWLTGLYDYNLPFNIHKYFDIGIVDGKYYTIDWSGYIDDPSGYSAGTGYTANDTNDSDNSTSADDGIFSKQLGSHDFGNSQVTGYTRSGLAWSSSSYAAMTYNADAHELLTKERKYGFEWKVNTDESGVGQTFSYTIYIYDSDGNGKTDSYSFSDITYNESNELKNLDNALANAEVANQYMHLLIDNTFYTNNQYHSNHTGGNYQLFTDLLSQETNDKTTLDIDYLRVYQQDGKRDIITPETESFNNGNHFGY